MVRCGCRRRTESLRSAGLSTHSRRAAACLAGPLAQRPDRTVRDAALMIQALAGPHRVIPTAHVTPRSTTRRSRTATCAVREWRTAATSARHPARCGTGARVRRWLNVLRTRLHAVEANPPVPDLVLLAPGVWAYSGDHYAAAEALIPNFWEASERSDRLPKPSTTRAAPLIGNTARSCAATATTRKRFAPSSPTTISLSPCCGAAPWTRSRARDDQRGEMRFLAIQSRVQPGCRGADGVRSGHLPRQFSRRPVGR